MGDDDHGHTQLTQMACHDPAVGWNVLQTGEC